MKKIILLVALSLLQSCIGAGSNSTIEANKNSYFPKVFGIDLEGKRQNLPSAFSNKLNLVVVAFKREQQVEVDTWIKAAEPLLKKNRNLNFYEIPLIYELSAFKRMWVNNGMRFGISNKEARKRIITVYVDRAKFFKMTKMKEEKIYALLIDNKGKIIWRREGEANSKKLSSLKKFL